MNSNQSIGLELRLVTNLIKKNIESRMQQKKYPKLTRMQGFIVGYLYRNSNRDVFQKDLEQEFSIRGSTVTAILQGMEKEGLIIRSPVENDHRLKKLSLTKEAYQRHAYFEKNVQALEEQMANGLTLPELENFFSVLQKIKQNLLQEEDL